MMAKVDCDLSSPIRHFISWFFIFYVLFSGFCFLGSDIGFLALSSVFCLLSSVFCLLSSALCLLSFIFYLLPPNTDSGERIYLFALPIF